MKCPYCKRLDCDPPYVMLHAEHFGSGTKRFKCRFCGKTIKVRIERILRVVSIEKTKEPSDW